MISVEYQKNHSHALASNERRSLKSTSKVSAICSMKKKEDVSEWVVGAIRDRNRVKALHSLIVELTLAAVHVIMLTNVTIFCSRYDSCTLKLEGHCVHVVTKDACRYE